MCNFQYNNVKKTKTFKTSNYWYFEVEILKVNINSDNYKNKFIQLK